MSKCMIGILGGMGPRSTASFIDAVVDQCQKLYGASLDEDFPKMMILSLPTPFYVDRPIDHSLMKKTIDSGLKQLESTGVNFIAMPCNSAHAYYSDLASSINISLLNIITETLPFLGSSGPVTLIGTQGTFDSGLYQMGFKNINLEFIFHSNWQKKINQIISLIKSGKVKEEACIHWNELLSDLNNSQVEQAVIACTDLNAVLPFSKTNIVFIDSTESLAKATVNKYLLEGG
ncbi:aspartate/glutamate racemase family protein [Desulfospira joergensenii]|uniref:aspartate/glutamate racemase family protein n=1 Tax=Desulfospira joergensenii TaxID=53329 RepID=UPI0003B6C161|nr:amino acid racemase [Desulfospira joergensenii]